MPVDDDQKLLASLDLDNVDRMAKHFAANFRHLTEIEGIIIRGHILIEYELDLAIEQTVVEKKQYKSEKFTFSQKVMIANMVGVALRYKSEISALNKLRNQIAHTLSYDDKYAHSIIKEMSKKYPEILVIKDNLKALGTAISFICGAIGVYPPVARKRLSLLVSIEELNKELTSKNIPKATNEKENI